jgi:C-terminal processing protease CtpA/Prc
VTQCADTLPLTERQLDNLVALARLLGYVRFFHPSEGVADADWNEVTLQAIGPVEEAADAESLAAALASVVAPLAPTVRVEEGSATTVDAPARPDGSLVVRWVHHGVYLGGWGGYASSRVTDERGRHRALLFAVFDAQPLRGCRLRATGMGHLSDAGVATATLGLRCGTADAYTPLASGPAVVELEVPQEAEAAELVITLTGRETLTFVAPLIEVTRGDETWRRLELPATELKAEPDDDIPLGWNVDMTVPYRVTAVDSGGHRALRAEPVPLPRTDEPLRVDLPGRVGAVIPMALAVTDPVPERAPEPSGPLPEAPAPAGSMEDRGTRLGNVVLVWSVLQHFYPYFDVVAVDWDSELARALTAAATAADGAAYLRVLRALMASLHDGHAVVSHPEMVPTHTLPLAWEVIEGELVVTSVNPDSPVARPGTVVEEIEGRAALEVLADEETLVSGSSQWKRAVALRSIRTGPPADVELGLTDAAGDRHVAVPRVPVANRATGFADALPERVAELGDGVWYIDVSRATAEEVEQALPQLRAATGVVVDFREYPQRGSERLLRLLTDKPIRSAQWRRPVTAWPDRHHVIFDRSAWFLQPERPGIEAPVAAIIGAGTISYGETCIGIVEAFGLATTVGAPTAGANGNVNAFPIPGGFRVGWTGMRVLKHDGSPHHTIGVLPDVPATRTLAGVRESHDEPLERAVEDVREGAAT